jgi:hypothetical protein
MECCPCGNCKIHGMDNKYTLVELIDKYQMFETQNAK